MDEGIGRHIVNKLKEKESLKGNQFLDLGTFHQLKLIDTIKLVSIENTFTETMILDIAPKDTKTFSDKLSKELSGKLTFICDKILVLTKYFLE